MSGTSLLPPRRIGLLQNAYKTLASELATGSASIQYQVQRILEAANNGSLGDLTRGYGLGPVVDGDLVQGDTSYSCLASREEALKRFPGMHHCKRILIGDCEMDVSFLQDQPIQMRTALGVPYNRLTSTLGHDLAVSSGRPNGHLSSDASTVPSSSSRSI